MVEKRLIDKNKLLDALGQWMNDDPYRKLRCPWERWVRTVGIYSLETVVKNMKTVDAVEVVRCRDCKRFDPIKRECCGNVVTDNEGGADFTINFEENDFCSFGERRSDEKINI